jgi:catechol 2,3-dioxygenase-like lactoylglutathione lyase family enzyme
MEHLIAKLVQDFERGAINRRELIQSLTVTAAVAITAAVPASAESKGFSAIRLNHISYQVADYAKTRDFYVDLLGMKVSGDDGKQCSLAVGDSVLIARNRPTNTPRVDHIAYTIANWDKNAVEAELKRHGLPPRLDLGGNEESFHVLDPDGFDLQISSGPMPQNKA